MKHAKHNRTPWVVLGGLAAVILCAMVIFALRGSSAKAKDVEIPGTRGTIAATVQLPVRSARGDELPLVVLCHGFTGNRQGDGHFAPLADDLAAQGIATVRLDFAGCGDSTEPYTAYTLANMAADVDSVIAYMQATYGTGKTALVGHSMGGRLASLYPQLGQYPVTALARWSPANGAGMRDSDPNAVLRASGLPVLLTYSGNERILSDTTQSETQAAVESLPGGQIVLDSFVNGDHNYTSEDPDTNARLDADLRQITVTFLTSHLQ